jgi:hypothetical protein
MGSSTVPASGGGKQPYRQAFYSSGTWTKPAGVNTATVTCIGGGGGSYANTLSIGGGGAGGYIKTIVDVSAISTATVTIGAGGVSTDTSANVSSGSSSSFGSLVFAHGGEGRIAAYNTMLAAGNCATTQDSGTAENTQNVSDGIAQARWSVLSTSQRTTANAWITTSFSSQIPSQPVAYNGSNLYVATANVSNEIWTSSNGITWTKNTTTTGSNQQVGWNGTYFVMVPNATGTTAYYGTNGTSWTTAALPSSVAWTGCVTSGTLSVAYSSNSTTAAYSTNGTTWTGVTLPVALNSAAANGMTVANGRIYFTGGTGQTYYTTTGSTWTTAGTTLAGGMISYNASSGVYLAHPYNGASGGASYYTSTDGVAWTSRSYTSQLPLAPWRSGAAYGTFTNPVVIDDRWFMFAGTSAAATSIAATQVLFSSLNGVNWTIVKYWNKGVNGTPITLNPSLVSSVMSAGTGRYLVYMTDNSSGLGTNVSTLLWSRYAVGGFQGQMVAGFNSTLGTANNHTGSAGAASSRGDVMVNVINVTGGNGNNNNYVYTAGLGIDGYCKGGAGLLAPDNMSNANVNIGNVNYGDGAPTFSGAPNGGNGLVIVEWWA